MTDNQIKWASQHDWYLTSSAIDGAIWVMDRWLDCNGKLHSKARSFHTFTKLREWAR